MKTYRSFIYLVFLTVGLHFLPGLSGAQKAVSPEKDRAKAAKEGAKVNLNTATKAELEALPGIGPETADEIIAARPFKSVDQVRDVRGIGDERFSQVRKQLTVRSERAHPAAPKQSQRKSERDQTISEHRSLPKRHVDLNTADAKTLESLPGIGPAIANSIIAARPFKSVDELKDVEGIGETRFEEIRPFITVGSTPRKGLQGEASGRAASASKGRVDENRTVSRSNPRVGGSQDTRARTTESRVNINTASKEELESLLGIGPVKAQAIIDARPFKSIDEVMKVTGIKEGTFEQLRDRITVR